MVSVVVTKENIGDIICQYENGERFIVKSITDNILFFQNENGAYSSLESRIVDGGIECDEDRIASFRNNLALARVLDAAETAAKRRLAPGQCDAVERQNASRVSDVVAEQRASFLNRLRTERQTMQAGPALAQQFLSDLVQPGTGASAIFFGQTVQYCGDRSDTSFHINGENVFNQRAVVAFLSELVAEHPHDPSFEDRLASARERAAQKQENSISAFDLER